MWILNTVTTKLSSIAFRSEKIYAFAKFLSNRSSLSLPSRGKAIAILQSASPPPASTLNISSRTWPARPTVDISVIVPCYNVENYVQECLQSILNQETKYTFEVICVDDGSTDSTLNILQKIKASNPKIRVIHQENHGLSGARNVGISVANGNTFIFVDSDDRLLPNAFNVLYDAFKKTDCDYVTASYKILSQNGRVITPLKGKRTHGAPWGRLYSREIWRHLEFPEGFWFEDTVQGFCIDPVFRSYYVDIPVALYRRNWKGISISSHRSKKGLDTLWIVSELLEWCQQLEIPFNQEMYDRTILQLGRILWSRTSALNGKEHRSMFVYACDLLASYDPNAHFKTSLSGRWKDVEKALKTRNYRLWRIAVNGL